MSTTGTVPMESKSAKKRKAKAEAAAANGGASPPSGEAAISTSESHPATNGVDSPGDSSFIKDLAKNIRNINKKLASSAKADTVVAENPGVSIDDLVAQKKLNADQKAQVLKKPALQSQLSQLEEQLSTFRAFAYELEEKAAKEKLGLAEAHESEIAKVKEDATKDAEDIKTKAVEDGLRVIIQFLHAAASKRQVEDVESDEARAFEGALLLVYQGNDTALSTLKNLIYGTDDKVTDVQGEHLNFTFAQVKESSLQSAQELPQSTEPEIEDAVAVPEEESLSAEAGIDNTVAHAGLTELDDAIAIQADASAIEAASDADVVPITAPEQTSTEDQAANAVAEGWDPQASMVTDNSAANDEWVQVPRDPAETESGVTATPAALQSSNSWAEEVGAAATNAEEKRSPENDGFSEVRRERGRGRGGRGTGRGEFRGRGRGGRDGHRGGGRGGRDGQGEGRRGRGGNGGGSGGGGARGEHKS